MNPTLPAIRDARIHLDGDSPEKRSLAVETGAG